MQHTFVATASAISFTGARPVFVDVDPKTYTMIPSQVVRAITPRSKAKFFQSTCTANRRIWINCSDRSPPSFMDDRRCLSGAWSALSEERLSKSSRYRLFQLLPAKNLGAFGDARLAGRRHAEIAQRPYDATLWAAQILATNFWRTTGVSDTVQAGVLRVKCRTLDMWNAATTCRGALRRVAAERALLAAPDYGGGSRACLPRIRHSASGARRAKGLS